jgi:hypothetical protein
LPSERRAIPSRVKGHVENGIEAFLRPLRAKQVRRLLEVIGQGWPISKNGRPGVRQQEVAERRAIPFSSLIDHKGKTSAVYVYRPWV